MPQIYTRLKRAPTRAQIPAGYPRPGSELATVEEAETNGHTRLQPAQTPRLSTPRVSYPPSREPREVRQGARTTDISASAAFYIR